nr:hypothetical protein [Mycoplasmopsis bovis]QQH18984.1 hypothetical protein HYE48_00850 [Mycoplasmopsis bovis]
MWQPNAININQKETGKREQEIKTIVDINPDLITIIVLTIVVLKVTIVKIADN